MAPILLDRWKLIGAAIIMVVRVTRESIWHECKTIQSYMTSSNQEKPSKPQKVGHHNGRSSHRAPWL